MSDRPTHNLGVLGQPNADQTPSKRDKTIWERNIFCLLAFLVCVWGGGVALHFFKLQFNSELFRVFSRSQAAMKLGHLFLLLAFGLAIPSD